MLILIIIANLINLRVFSMLMKQPMADDFDLEGMLEELDLSRKDYLYVPKDNSLEDYYKQKLSKLIDFEDNEKNLDRLLDYFANLDHYYVSGSAAEEKMDIYISSVDEKAKKAKEYGSNLNYYSYTPGFHIPPDVIMEKVPQTVLGPNVLGRAFPGKRLIQILDTLYGDMEHLVKIHEVEHILYPQLTEWEVRVRSEDKARWIRPDQVD